MHDVYGGQRQGGMSTPLAHPVLFLFTGEGGAEHGYKDEFRPSGVYHYTGEGQRGNMSFARANRALRDHASNEKRVYLFEAFGDGNVRYMGEATYLGHHMEERQDTEGFLRQAIVFELDLEIDAVESALAVQEPNASYSVRSLRGKSLKDLRRLALAGTSKTASTKERRQNVWVRSEAVRTYVLNRSEAVRTYVLKRADGTCEGCEQPAPFVTKRRQPPPPRRAVPRAPPHDKVVRRRA